MVLFLSSNCRVKCCRHVGYMVIFDKQSWIECKQTRQLIVMSGPVHHHHMWEVMRFCMSFQHNCRSSCSTIYCGHPWKQNLKKDRVYNTVLKTMTWNEIESEATLDLSFATLLTTHHAIEEIHCFAFFQLVNQSKCQVESIKKFESRTEGSRQCILEPEQPFCAQCC